MRDYQLKALAERPPPQEPFTRDACEEVTRLALLIAQAAARRTMLANPQDVPPGAMVPWEDRNPGQRGAMMAGTIRVVQAMLLLGLIEAGDVREPGS